MIPAKSAKKKFLLRRIKTGCLYLTSTVLCTLNNVKSYCLAGSNKTFDRILLISLRHIGDFVWATSVVRALSMMYPGIKFDVVVHPDNQEIASIHRNVENVLTFTDTRGRGPGLPTGRLDWSNLKNVLRKITSNEYDVLIILSPDSLLNLLVQILFLFKKRPVKVCDVSPMNILNILTRTTKKKHPLDIFKHAITPLAKNGKIKELVPFIELPEVGSPQSKSNPKECLTIGFCVGAGWRYKRWSKENYARLANMILQEYKNASITIYAGNSEDVEVANFIKDSCRYSERVETFRKGIMDFLRSLQQCDLVISNDSGPAHLSSALAVPLLVIFGPTSPERDAPRGFSSVKVYWGKVECSPCDQLECFNTIQQKCMNSVLPAEVFEGVKEIIQSL